MLKELLELYFFTTERYYSYLHEGDNAHAEECLKILEKIKSIVFKLVGEEQN